MDRPALSSSATTTVAGVSKRSQAKRAAKAKSRAKQRARTQHRQGKPADTGDPFGSSPDDQPDLGRGVYDGLRYGQAEQEREAAFLRDCEDAHQVWIAVESGEIPVSQAATLSLRTDEAAFLNVAEHHLLAGVEQAYACGFTPSEVIRQVRLGATAAAIELGRWVLSADHERRHDQRITRAWTDEVKAEATTAYVAKQDWVADWWHAHDSRRAAAQTMFEFIKVSAELGPVDVIMQPPSGITPWSPVVGHDSEASDPVLNQIRALLAKAESTEYEAEASAFTAKAQQLMTKHAIDHAVLDAGLRDPGTPSIMRIPLDPPYADSKATLLHIVAEHLRCRAIQINRLKMSTVIGADVDLRAVNLMFASLLVQAQHALQASSAGARAGSHERSQSFRSSFLGGFTARISERLTEANEQAYAEDDRTDAYLPVLRAKDDALDDFIRERYSLTFKSGRSSYDRSGFLQGQAAGDRARFGSGSISSHG